MLKLRAAVNNINECESAMTLIAIEMKKDP